MCHRVGLHVPVIVFAGPNEAAVRFHSLGHHVVDQAMLVPDASVLKLTDVFSEDKRAKNTSSLHLIGSRTIMLILQLEEHDQVLL